MEKAREKSWAALKDRTLVAPSLLSADFSKIADEIATVARGGAEVLHLDVMDGHFVPNITFGPPVVASIRRVTDLWLDTHLMITDPASFLEPFARAGADSITIHPEVSPDMPSCRAEADRLGIKLGIAIRPDTALNPVLREYGEAIDLLMIMSVMPGFGGQSYLDGSTERLGEAAEFCSRSARKPVLLVDGGIGQDTIGIAAGAGARWLVAGNAVFRQPDPAAALRRLVGIVGNRP